MRRSCCVLLWLIAAGVVAPGRAAADVTLRELAEARGLRIGAMILDNSWETTAQRELVAREFNAATIGTFWLRTRPGKLQYDWELTDRAVAWAASAGLAIHLHPLVYAHDNFAPNWLKQSDYSEAPAILESHIETAVNRYKAGGQYNPSSGVVWDVVNEAVDPNGGYRDNWWLRAMPAEAGEVVPEFIIEAFRIARETDPDAVLLYNDHDMEVANGYQTGKWNRVKEIIERLVEEDLIDGLGWELHTTPSEVLGSSFALDERMEWVKSLGLMNFVTELDIEIGPGEEALALQGEAYQKVTEIWLEHNNGGWLQTWGVSDKHTWLGSEKRPLLFDENYNPKPAYEGVQNALMAVPESSGFWMTAVAGVMAAAVGRLVRLVL